MRNFFSKYIDTKKLVTGIVQAILVGLFLLIWNNYGQIKAFLGPAFSYSVSIPIVPTIILLIIMQYFVHKGLLKFQAKFGKRKSISVGQWNVSTTQNTSQWVSYKEINLNTGLLTSVKCQVFLKSSYLRFGFKLLDKSASILGTNGILTAENNGLFHIQKASNSNRILTTSYKNGIQDGTDIYSGDYIADTPIKVELRISPKNFLEFLVNEQSYYQTYVKTEYRERLILMAWGDGNEYEMEITNIQVSTKV